MKNHYHFIAIDNDYYDDDEDDDLFSLYQRADKQAILEEEDEEDIEDIEDMRFRDMSPIDTSSAASRIDDEDEEKDFVVVIPQNLSFEQQNYQFPIQYSDDNHNNLENKKFVTGTGTGAFFGNETVFTSYCSYSTMSTSHDLDHSTHTTGSHKVVLKLSKSQCKVVAGDNGYNDEDDHVAELESQCTFYPLLDEDEDEEEQETKAATKIQAIWRGYQFRKNKSSSSNNNNTQNHGNANETDVFLQLLLLCGRFHQTKIDRFSKRIDLLEHRIKEEKAMRVAFETAMEDLTELIDQQQIMLYDRLDHQTNMRRSCEKKIKALEETLDPLQTRLKKETQARKRLEMKMTHVLDELRDTKEQIVLSQKKDDDDDGGGGGGGSNRRKNDHSKRSTRVSLEKQQKQTMVKSTAPPKTSSSSNSSNHRIRRSIIPERPSVVPSRRHPTDSIKYKTKRLNQA